MDSVRVWLRLIAITSDALWLLKAVLGLICHTFRNDATNTDMHTASHIAVVVIRCGLVIPRLWRVVIARVLADVDRGAGYSNGQLRWRLLVHDQIFFLLLYLGENSRS